MQRDSSIGSLRLRPSWCVLTLISSWQQEDKQPGRPRMRPRRFLSSWSGQGIDPVEAALVENLARPGGNVTGLTNLTGELGGKRLELFKETVPKLARVAALYNPAAPGSVRQLKEDLPVAARAIGLTIQLWEVRHADDFERVFAAMSKQHPDGLYVLGGTVMRVTKNRSPSLR